MIFIHSNLFSLETLVIWFTTSLNASIGGDMILVYKALCVVIN